jgi:hypothetical protein
VTRTKERLLVSGCFANSEVRARSLRVRMVLSPERSLPRGREEEELNLATAFITLVIFLRTETQYVLGTGTASHYPRPRTQKKSSTPRLIALRSHHRPLALSEMQYPYFLRFVSVRTTHCRQVARHLDGAGCDTRMHFCTLSKQPSWLSRVHLVMMFQHLLSEWIETFVREQSPPTTGLYRAADTSFSRETRGNDPIALVKRDSPAIYTTM